MIPVLEATLMVPSSGVINVKRTGASSFEKCL